jgi:hypothetical protein
MESFRHISNSGYGDWNTVIFKGGKLEEPRLREEILPGGGDWETDQDHDGDQQTGLKSYFIQLFSDVKARGLMRY